jgi:ribosomal protein S27E
MPTSKDAKLRQEKQHKREKQEKIDALCKDCGQEFSAFLQQMEAHNAKVVVCPSCGKVHDYGDPPKSTKASHIGPGGKR